MLVGNGHFFKSQYQLVPKSVAWHKIGQLLKLCRPASKDNLQYLSFASTQKNWQEQEVRGRVVPGNVSVPVSIDNQSHCWLAFCCPTFCPRHQLNKMILTLQIALSCCLPQRKVGTEGDVLVYASFPRTHQMVFSLVNGHATFHVYYPMNGCSPHSSPLFEQASLLPLSLWLWNNCPHCPNAIPC